MNEWIDIAKIPTPHKMYLLSLVFLATGLGSSIDIFGQPI